LQKIGKNPFKKSSQERRVKNHEFSFAADTHAAHNCKTRIQRTRTSVDVLAKAVWQLQSKVVQTV